MLLPAGARHDSAGTLLLFALKMAKLAAVFSGELGGPLAVLSGLVGENLGVQRVPMRFSAEGGGRVLTVGNLGRLAIRDLVPTGVQNGPPARLTGVFHPVTAAGFSDGQEASSRGIAPASPWR